MTRRQLQGALPFPPSNDHDCWPFSCRDYHETWAHIEGEDPCDCPCHLPKRVHRHTGETAMCNEWHGAASVRARSEVWS